MRNNKLGAINTLYHVAIDEMKNRIPNIIRIACKKRRASIFCRSTMQWMLLRRLWSSSDRRPRGASLPGATPERAQKNRSRRLRRWHVALAASGAGAGAASTVASAITLCSFYSKFNTLDRSSNLGLIISINYKVLFLKKNKYFKKIKLQAL